MIFVILGTQDKQFSRLLTMIEEAIVEEIINEEVIVQSGHTKFESKNMKVFDYVSSQELQQYIQEARLIITHGGVGSIVDSIKQDKIVIACARLEKFGEHQNNHQKEIISKFISMGYILEWTEHESFKDVQLKIEQFEPKKYKNTSSEVVNYIANYIDSH